MAFNLRAILRLDDQFSDPMRKVERQIAKNKRMMDQLDTATSKVNTSTSRAARSHSGFSKSLGGLTRGLGGLKSALFGAVAGYAAYEGAKKVFESTVLEAAKFEQSSVMIKAMFDDKAASKAYMEMVDKIAINSPILDSQAMYANSKGFITASKDVKQLEKMWSLAERMAAIDPVQGTEGAVFALRELFSGDAISMVERFEMPREIMNDIKKMDLPDQLAALDEYFNKIGMTSKLINEMGDTTLGKWSQVKEKWNVIMREMGEPALEPLVKFFDDILARFDSEDFTRFGKIGGKMISGVVTGLTEAAVDIYDWFTNLINSEEFKKQTTVYGKVSFVIDDIYAKFLEWLDNGGNAKIEATAKVLLESLAAAIDSSDKLVESAVKMGGAIGKGLLKGFYESVDDSFVLSVIDNTVVSKDPASSDGWAVKTAAKLTASVFGVETEEEKKKKKKKSTGKNGGLAYVPYNGYEASLHKGEQILTRGQADDYRAGKAGRGGVVISGNQFIVREEADINKIAAKLADLIEASGGAGAYNGA